MIVDKRIEDSGSVQGYSFFIGSGNLGFQLADGTGTNFFSTLPSSGCTNYSGCQDNQVKSVEVRKKFPYNTPIETYTDLPANESRERFFRSRLQQKYDRRSLS